MVKTYRSLKGIVFRPYCGPDWKLAIINREFRIRASIAGDPDPSKSERNGIFNGTIKHFHFIGGRHRTLLLLIMIRETCEIGEKRRRTNRIAPIFAALPKFYFLSPAPPDYTRSCFIWFRSFGDVVSAVRVAFKRWVVRTSFIKHIIALNLPNIYLIFFLNSIIHTVSHKCNLKMHLKFKCFFSLCFYRIHLYFLNWKLY